jgi:integrase
MTRRKTMGMGRIFRRKSRITSKPLSTWSIAYYVDGKEVRESARTTSYAEAQALLRDRLKEVGEGNWLPAARQAVTVAEILDALALEYENNDRASLRTLRGHIQTWKAALGAAKALRVTTPRLQRNVRRALARIARKAGLGHVSPHDLRHSFGSALIAAGTSPAYVQKQMGHASIQLTVDTYGSAFPFEDRQGVAVLDDPPMARPTGGNGSRTVATRPARRRASRQVAEKPSEPWRDRTSDPLLKRQLLYQLS